MGPATPDMTVSYIYDAFNRWIGETITKGETDHADAVRLRRQADRHAI